MKYKLQNGGVVKLQRPGQETSTIWDKPTEYSYRLQVPEFKIPTITNLEYSVEKGLATRKAKDAYDAAYKEYLEQHPVSTGSRVSYVASSSPAFAGDVSFSALSQDPVNTTNEDAHKYAVEKSGYNPGNPNDVWRAADAMRDQNTLRASAVTTILPLLLTASAGTFGIIPKLGADLKFAYDGYKSITGPEGWAKTKNFWKEGRYGRAAWSGLGDLFDASLLTHGVGTTGRFLGNSGKYAREALDAAKFNFMNRGTGFRMDYPWQIRPNAIPNGSITLENVPVLQERPLQLIGHQRIFGPENNIGNRKIYEGPIRIPGNDSQSMYINFSNYFGKPISDLTVSDWDSFINGTPTNTFGLNIANLRKNFNRYKNVFSSGDTYYGAISGSQLFNEIRQMSRDRVPYDMSTHQDVLDYMREYVGPQYLSNLQEAVTNHGGSLSQVDINHIKDVFANPSKYIDISHGYTRPGTGGYAVGSKITAPFDVNFSDRDFAHELHHALRNYLQDYLQPNYDVFGFTDPFGRHASLASGEFYRNGRQPYFDFELDAMHDLAFNKLQSSDKTPSSEIGAVITSEYTFPRFKAMKEALGRFPTPEELWNTIDRGSLKTIDPPLAYREAIGSAYRDNRHLDKKFIITSVGDERFRRRMDWWNNQPLWWRLWNSDQKPEWRGITSRLESAHKQESINNFRNAIKRVMEAVPSITVPAVGLSQLPQKEK